MLTYKIQFKLLIFISLQILFVGKSRAQKLEPKTTESTATDTTAFVIRSYQLNDNNHKVFYPIDTIFESVHEYTTPYQKSPSWTRLTNLGQASLNNLYFERVESKDFIFWQPYSCYWHDNSDQLYYINNKPYTRIKYTRAQRNAGYEQSVSVDHNRQVNDKLNVGINYSVISTPGIDGHRNDTRHTQALAFAAYNSLRYQLHTNISYRKIRGSQNGGFIDNGYYYHIDSISPQLTTAEDRLVDLTFYADQEYLLGKVDSIKQEGKVSKPIIKSWASLRHRVQFKRNNRVFEDEKINLDTDNKLIFYPDTLINGTQTYDSIYFHQLRNHFEIEIKEGFVPNVNFGLRGGIVHEYNSSYMFRDYLNTVKNKEVFQSTGVTASVFNRVSDYWAWDAKAELMLLGYKKGDVRLNGVLNRYFFSGKDSSIVRLKAKINRTRPNYYLNSYYSNHYQWDNDFNNQEEIATSLAYIHPKWRMEFRMNTNYNRNYVYLNNAGHPTQHPDAFLTIGFSARKKYKWRNWGFETQLFYQKTSNTEVLRIPEYIGQQSVYFDKRLFKDALRLQIGLDASITSQYKGQYFNPALGLFQTQDNHRIGNFPDVDAFINLRIRNARLFFKYNNLYQNYGNKWFFTSANTVDSNSLFRFGVYWHFTN